MDDQNQQSQPHAEPTIEERHALYADARRQDRAFLQRRRMEALMGAAEPQPSTEEIPPES